MALDQRGSLTVGGVRLLLLLLARLVCFLLLSSMRSLLRLLLLLRVRFILYQDAAIGEVNLDLTVRQPDEHGLLLDLLQLLDEDHVVRWWQAGSSLHSQPLRRRLVEQHVQLLLNQQLLLVLILYLLILHLHILGILFRLIDSVFELQKVGWDGSVSHYPVLELALEPSQQSLLLEDVRWQGLLDILLGFQACEREAL